MVIGRGSTACCPSFSPSENQPSTRRERERSGDGGSRLGRRGFRYDRLSTRCSTPYSVLCLPGRADRPRSAAGMGSGFISRIDDVPDLMPDADQQGRWSLPGANGVRGRLAVGGWRKETPGAPSILESSCPPVLGSSGPRCISPGAWRLSCPRVLAPSCPPFPPLAHVSPCPHAPTHYPANALAKIARTSDSGSRPAGGTSMDVKSAAFAVPAACTAERNPSSKRA